AHLGLRDFNAALLADHTPVLQALVLAAQALVVLDGAEDLGAEQAVTLGLEGPVVDGFRLLDFTEGPGTDLFRRGQADADGIEVLVGRELLEQVEQGFHVCVSSTSVNHERSSSMSMPSDRISLTSTLNDSGMPASMACSPLTMDSYTLVRPCTSSDLTVSISCRM